jgi:VanZ family protein
MQVTFRAAAWLLALAIVVLSLSPPSLRPITALGHGFEHVLIFLITGTAFGFGYPGRVQFLATALVAFAATIEVAQNWVPGRHARASDFLLDAGASCVGIGLAYALSKFRARHEISDLQIVRAPSMASELINKPLELDRFELDRIETDTKEGGAEPPSPLFVSELPHPGFSRPDGVFKTGNILLKYYENPRTIGSVAAGIEAAPMYPQVIVVYDGERPLQIIRAEENISGGLFLCSLAADGGRAILNDVAPMSRDEFVRRVGELLLK